MKPLSPSPQTSSARSQPCEPSRPCGADPLLGTLYRLCAMITGGSIEDISGRLNASKALVISRLVGRTVRAIIGVQMAKDRARLKRGLLSNPVWRARVFRELGGEPALRRWEAQSARASMRIKARRALASDASRSWDNADIINSDTIASDTIIKPPKQRSQRGSQRGSQQALKRQTMPAKTDFEGQFRISPVRRGGGFKRAGRGYHYSGNGRAASAGIFKPIGLLPRELRGPSGGDGNSAERSDRDINPAAASYNSAPEPYNASDHYSEPYNAPDHYNAPNRPQRHERATAPLPKSQRAYKQPP